MSSDNKVAVVSIGRNEGERFYRCLQSISTQSKLHVYVDSGSTDNSVDYARSMGVDVVDLDMSLQFTAARARNEGFTRVRELFPLVEYIQFVDGDCEIVSGWVALAVNFLEEHPDVAIVCGRRRERFPEETIYNMLCNYEWDTPVGETKYCGGDALVRVSAFEGVNGYRAEMIAGEEPELCVRLREANWKVWRLGEEMTLHDAAITRFSQWWNRTQRAGYAFAEGAYLHGSPPERHWVAESRRAKIWGFLIPLTIVGLSNYYGPWALLLLMIYPLQVCRIALISNPARYGNWWHALFLVIGKFPEVIGQLRFYYKLIVGRSTRLIEYK